MRRNYRSILGALLMVVFGLTLLLVSAILEPGTTASELNAAQVSSIVKYDQDFESAVPGVAPSAGSVGLSSIQARTAYAGNAIIVDTRTDNGHTIQVLSLIANPDPVNGYNYISKKFFPSNGEILPYLTHIELRIRADQNVGQLALTGRGNNPGAEWAPFVRLQNGTLYFMNQPAMAYDADVWYEIRLDIDPVALTGAIYVDDVLLLDDIAIPAAHVDMTGETATEFEFRLFNYNRGAYAELLVFDLDEIRVSMTVAEREYEVTKQQIEHILAPLSHPFLIVNESLYPDWRDKAAILGSPWAGMRTDAMSDARNIWYTHRQSGSDPVYNTAPGVPVVTSATQVQSASLINGTIVSSAALAYILDPANAADYVAIVGRMIEDYYTYVYPNLGKDGNLTNNARGVWDTHVVPSSAFVDLVVALDIMRGEFQTLGTLNDYEEMLEEAAEWFWDDQAVSAFDWKAGLYGARTIWALYRKDAERAAEAIQDYKDYQRNSVQEDGVFLGGAYYAAERYAPPPAKRSSKLHVMDVLEFLGLGDFYSDPLWRNFYEWTFGYAFSPVTRLSPDGQTAKKDYYIFGDTPISGSTWNESYANHFNAASATHYKAHLFSDEAFLYAGATVGYPNRPIGRLWHYAGYKEPFPDPEPIPSRIFPTGNAVFFEPWTHSSAANRILSGSFWTPNIRNYNAGHARYDVNAIHLTAYGEHVLRGAGYPGYTPMMNNPDYYLSSVSHNTVMIDGQPHVNRQGAGLDHGQPGILEAFAADRFGYASGHSGEALPNGVHVRNFVQVGGQNDAGGYWLLVDEIQADTGGDPVQLMLHPAGTAVQETAAGEQYTARSNYRRAIPNSAVDLTVYFASEPDDVQIKTGLFAAIGQTAEEVEYIEASFATNANGQQSLLTVLFPHDPTHPLAAMTRASAGGYTGATISQSAGVTDFAWAADGQQLESRGLATFQGLAGLYRQINGDTVFYFIRKGTQFRTEATGGLGFTASEPISVYVDGSAGHVIAAEPARVVWYAPSVQSVALNGASLVPVSSGSGWIEVDIPAGHHTLELLD